ncbi:MAG: hypothetical protein LAT65_13275 [Saccharospirillum sp.]|nr:hypothetical protein [Saccharospirillum sp.]
MTLNIVFDFPPDRGRQYTVKLLVAHLAFHKLRPVLHSVLVVLMMLSPLQAAVHSALMSSQELMDATPKAPMAMAHHAHEGSAHAQHIADHPKHHHHSDLPCMELCLMVTIVPSIPLVDSPTTGLSPTALADGKPLNPGQPTAPPPKPFLL